MIQPSKKTKQGMGVHLSFLETSKSLIASLNGKSIPIRKTIDPVLKPLTVSDAKTPQTEINNVVKERKQPQASKPVEAKKVLLLKLVNQ